MRLFFILGLLLGVSVSAFAYSNGTQDFGLGSYVGEINRRVKMNWDKPRYAASGETVLKMVVLKDGTVKNIEIVKASGNDNLDKSCMLAVKLSQPFKPLPVGYKGSSVDVQLTFEAGINKPIKYW